MTAGRLLKKSGSALHWAVFGSYVDARRLLPFDQPAMFYAIDLNERIPANHPLRPIEAEVNRQPAAASAVLGRLQQDRAAVGAAGAAFEGPAPAMSVFDSKRSAAG